MDKYIIVSTNNNPDYYFYLPYIEKAWASFGWNLCVMITQDVDVKNLKVNLPTTLLCRLPDIPELRMETIAQVGRLYAANYLPLDSFAMTSDMDLLPLSNYWHPKEDEITVYGHDLTDFSYFPMGYTAMPYKMWREVFNLSFGTKEDMVRDANEYKHMAMSKDWEQWWNYDWRLLTDRLRNSQYGITFINRGRQSNGFAAGRIDRGNSMAHVEGQLIDAHCENNNVQHPDKLNRFIEIFENAHGKL